MSIYKNQAQRVIDHISEKLQMTAENVEKIFKFNVAMMENRIEMMHIKTKMNGKKCADALIQAWEASNPEYITNEYKVVHLYEGLTFRMKVLPKEIITYYAGPEGDYLHSTKYSGEELTDTIKNSICEDVIVSYIRKTSTL
jgi:hypothetical protein